MAIRFIYLNRWRSGVIINHCSEHPQNPAEDTQIDSLSYFWRTRYGTGSGNGLFVVTDSNKYIDFDEGGAELTATLTLGSYNGLTLAAEIKTQLDAAGALTYTVVYSESTAKFTISAGSNFTLRLASGSHCQKVTNGDLEAWLSSTDATSWTETLVGTSTVNKESVEVHGGSFSARFDIDSSNDRAEIFQAITLIAGAKYRVSVWYKNSAADKTGVLRIRNSTAAVYLNSSGTWQVAACVIPLPNSTEWANFTLDFEAHASYTSYQIHTPTSATAGHSLASSSIYVDDITVLQLDAFSALVGFNNAADKTGAATYTSDYRRLHYPKAFIDIDLLVACEANFIGLLGHNISSAAVIKLYGADDTAFTTNLTTDTITWASGSIYFFLSASRTKRYFRVSIEDPTNTGAYIQVSTISLGKYFEPSRNYITGGEEGPDDLAEMVTSDSLNRYGQEKPMLYAWSLPFSGLSDSEKAEVKAMLIECGIHRALVVCFDSTVPATTSYLANLTEISKPVYVHLNNWDWTANIQEFV